MNHLSLPCEQERYKNEEEIIRKTWAKDILYDKYENLKLYRDHFLQDNAEKK